MKRLTVNETWEQCLAMWKWISRRCEGVYSDESRHVSRLKDSWVEKMEIKGIKQNCFFCHKSSPGDEYDWDCDKCPGVKVDGDFHCKNQEYHYMQRPRLFYAELKRLNKIRLAKKK